MFAHIEASTIVEVRGSLPRAARNQSGQTVCPPGGLWTTVQHESCGWFEVVENPQPEDTLESTFDADVVLLEGTPTLVWSERPKTEEELELAARVTSLEERVDAIEEIVLDRPDPDEGETPVWESPCPPNAIVRWPDALSDRFRNVSGAWLNATPGEYPIGYVNLDVSEVPAWAVGVAYIAGDQVTYLGFTYQALQPHTSQVGWEPSVATSLWTIVT